MEKKYVCTSSDAPTVPKIPRGVLLYSALLLSRSAPWFRRCAVSEGTVPKIPGGGLTVFRVRDKKTRSASCSGDTQYLSQLPTNYS